MRNEFITPQKARWNSVRKLNAKDMNLHKDLSEMTVDEKKQSKRAKMMNSKMIQNEGMYKDHLELVFMNASFNFKTELQSTVWYSTYSTCSTSPANFEARRDS